jgi:hypothetical protein
MAQNWWSVLKAPTNTSIACGQYLVFQPALSPTIFIRFIAIVIEKMKIKRRKQHQKNVDGGRKWDQKN